MTKYAVCVGNNYPGTDAELAGCVNDADDWARLLVQSGYEVHTMREAPKAWVVAALVEMVDRARYGDRCVFTFSGHGSWVPDRDGDEADRRDEVLCMADYRAGGLLSDDELQTIFGRLKFGVGALILSDSCHSGTVSRFTGGHAYQTPRFLSPAHFTDMTDDQVRAREALPASNPRATASLISGCGDLEFSYDAWFGNRANGAFTRAAVDAYKPGISLGSWFTAVRRVLPTLSYPQSPQVTYASPYRRYAKAL